MPDFEDSLLDKGLLPFAELVSEENRLIYGPLALSTAAKVMKSHASRFHVDSLSCAVPVGRKGTGNRVLCIHPLIDHLHIYEFSC